MSFQALGPLSVRTKEGSVRLRPAHQRLLAGLLLDPDCDVSTDRLMDRMWNGSPPATARNTLHAHVSSLRRTLPGVIISGRDRYRLALEDHDFDVLNFTDLVAEAAERLAAGEPGASSDQASRALRMWRGDPFSDLVDIDAAIAERARLTELRLSAAMTLAESMRLLDRPAGAIAALEALIVEHPLNEALREQLAHCLYQAGRPADSLRAVGDVRRSLAEQLGVDPGPRLQELEDKILVHHPELAPRRPNIKKRSLPDYRTSFVGREEDIARLGDLIGRHRIVTITGAPGMGKTRLAIETVKSVQDRFEDGVVLIRLVEASSEADVSATIAASVGLADSVTDLDELRRHLADRHCLLILDNCEHVIDSIRQFADAQGLPGSLQILATSRTSLGVAGEQVWRLAPLPVPDSDESALEYASVRLLVDRVSAAHGTATIQSSDAPHLVELCRRTGGIPLALELAARWVPWVGLRETVGLALDPAPNGAEPATPHHESLARAIDWSVRALSEQDASALRAAAAFRGTFTLDAFWQVCLGDRPRPEAAAALARLVDASLVQVESLGQIRYRVLEPLREHAQRSVAEASARSIADRHANWFERRAASVSPANGDSRQVRLSEIDEELGDIRGAMRHLLEAERPAAVAAIATSLSSYWFARYLGTEAYRWLSEALAGDLDSETRLAALSAAGWAAYSTADYTTGEARYEECLALARGTGNRFREAEALYGLARIHLPRRIREGRSLFQDALDIFDETGAELQAAECRLWLGLRAASAGEVASARAWLDPSIRMLEGLGHLREVSVGHRYLSLAAWHDGDEVTARHHLDLAEGAARADDDQRALSGAYIQRALVEGRWGDPARAARAIIDALAPIPENNDIDFCLIAFGAFPLLLRLERFELASRLLAHLDRIYDEYGWTPLEDRFPVAAEFRAATTKGLVNADLPVDRMPESSAAMAAELVDELTAIARGPDHGDTVVDLPNREDSRTVSVRESSRLDVIDPSRG